MTILTKPCVMQLHWLLQCDIKHRFRGGDFTVLSVIQIMSNDRISDELGKTWKEMVVDKSRHSPGVYLGLSKFTKT
jgi:hypothetical protein